MARVAGAQLATVGLLGACLLASTYSLPLTISESLQSKLLVLVGTTMSIQQSSSSLLIRVGDTALSCVCH